MKKYSVPPRKLETSKIDSPENLGKAHNTEV